MKRAIYLIGVFALAGVSLSGLAQDKKPPSPQAIGFAKQTTDLLQATLFAALLQEFSETTPDNVAQGKQSIGLVFNDRNTNMRLVGTLEPLGHNDEPRDTFEETALASALQGQPSENVEKVEGEWVYRRSIPLSNFHPSCVMCHKNFEGFSSTTWVGALMLKTPIP